MGREARRRGKTERVCKSAGHADATSNSCLSRRMGIDTKIRQVGEGEQGRLHRLAEKIRLNNGSLLRAFFVARFYSDRIFADAFSIYGGKKNEIYDNDRKYGRA